MHFMSNVGPPSHIQTVTHTHTDLTMREPTCKAKCKNSTKQKELLRVARSNYSFQET